MQPRTGSLRTFTPILVHNSGKFNANYFKATGTNHGDFALLSGKGNFIVSSLDYAAFSLPGFKKVKREKGWLKKLLQRKRELLVDFTAFDAREFGQLRKELKGFKIGDASALLEDSRVSKTSTELKLLKRASEISQRAIMEVGSSRNLENKTELQAQREFEKIALDRDSRMEFFMALSGRNSASPHAFSSSKKIGKGPLLIDGGVRFENYCSDNTHCFLLNAKQESEFEGLKEIFSEITKTCKVGASGREIQELSQELLKQRGFPKLPHAIGHGVGLEVHERPMLGAPEKLGENSVLAIEPSSYFREYGLRFERTVLVGKTGSRLL
jgi:Xaa-Pro dipeptidase